MCVLCAWHVHVHVCMCICGYFVYVCAFIYLQMHVQNVCVETTNLFAQAIRPYIGNKALGQAILVVSGMD